MHKIAKMAFMLLLLTIASTAKAQEAQLTPIGKNVYHFFSGFFSSIVVIGDKGVLVSDPAWASRATQMKTEIAKLTKKPITHVVLSHEHYDHAGGTEVFAKAAIICHATCAKLFALDTTGNAPKKVSKSFETELTIDLGNKTVELKHLGAGDGVATTIIYVPQDEVVATTDLYSPKSLTAAMWIDDKNYLGTRKILNEVAKWPLKHAISGHSADTSPAALRENAAYLNDLYDAVKRELDAAIATDGRRTWIKLISGPLPKTLKLPKYKDWKGYKEHFPKHVFRMGMSIMHGG